MNKERHINRIRTEKLFEHTLSAESCSSAFSTDSRYNTLKFSSSLILSFNCSFSASMNWRVFSDFSNSSLSFRCSTKKGWFKNSFFKIYNGKACQKKQYPSFIKHIHYIMKKESAVKKLSLSFKALVQGNTPLFGHVNFSF